MVCPFCEKEMEIKDSFFDIFDPKNEDGQILCSFYICLICNYYSENIKENLDF